MVSPFGGQQRRSIKVLRQCSDSKFQWTALCSTPCSRHFHQYVIRLPSSTKVTKVTEAILRLLGEVLDASLPSHRNGTPPKVGAVWHKPPQPNSERGISERGGPIAVLSRRSRIGQRLMTLYTCRIAWSLGRCRSSLHPQTVHGT